MAAGACSRVVETSRPRPTRACARATFFPRPRFLRFLTVVVGLGRGPPRVTVVFGRGVPTSTTPPRAVVTVASAPRPHPGRRGRPRGREGHRRALPVPGRARRHPRHKSYLGVGLPPITESQGQEARTGARGAFAGRVRQEGPDEEAPRHRCIGRGARHPRQGRRERCLRCGEAAADGPGRVLPAVRAAVGRGLLRVGWARVGPFTASFRVVVAAPAPARAHPLLNAGSGCCVVAIDADFEPIFGGACLLTE